MHYHRSYNICDAATNGPLTKVANDWLRRSGTEKMEPNQAWPEPVRIFIPSLKLIPAANLLAQPGPYQVE
ncbi:hypothetical protein AAHA92_14401 [Salvia divinorum]|uniref:Uncharacterized protein n=1 Tax=Salvia divinorum TaxID=28513 RepID=A0ABD1HBF9_SALDI